ncbi:hypothetical protein M1M34_gp113 [Haloarcula tailed virus 2]|uniref:Uncharacterized protein n=1 Tax=Haloarcula tailed virus 2 TaxID=2877989 RepID=A0AAE8XYY2_9CAUD|nr:hypothetical protein M1M34_gp113 [Haloarcula tailed virus 2]UBF23220.1 hypothetical protein HATV-2_gp69 [Haloarcula tailed virus 2]
MNKAVEVYDTTKCQRVALWYYGMPDEVRTFLEDQGYMLREHEYQ